MNLVEGLEEELERNRRILGHIEGIDDPGLTFMKITLRADIKYAEAAGSSCDPILMLKAYQRLKANKE